ncbi:hypothetical protein BS17DRAFT_161708 [Gyrodon lividus]|nr:hypothetical protein BS17DRAFT_161708 [Gyrodon lividus]
MFHNPFAVRELQHGKLIILTGSPGAGKSLYLYVLLELRLQAKLPTLPETEDKTSVLFTDAGVHGVASELLHRSLVPAVFQTLPKGTPYHHGLCESPVLLSFKQQCKDRQYCIHKLSREHKQRRT